MVKKFQCHFVKRIGSVDMYLENKTATSVKGVNLHGVYGKFIIEAFFKYISSFQLR